MTFQGLTQDRYNGIFQHSFHKHKRGAWWRMRKYLEQEDAPYMTIPEDNKLEDFDEEYHDNDDAEYESKMEEMPQEGIRQVIHVS